MSGVPVSLGLEAFDESRPGCLSADRAMAELTQRRSVVPAAEMGSEQPAPAP
jgi:hypothetical protein